MDPKGTNKSLKYNNSGKIIRIPDEVIDQVKELDIVEALSPYITVKKCGSGFEAICPFHQDRNPSLKINQAKRLYKCFSCGKSGKHAIYVVMKVKSVGWYDAVRLIAKDHQISIPEIEMSDEEETAYKSREAIYNVNHWAAEWFIKQLHDSGNIKALDYLKSRWDEEHIDHFSLGYAPAGWTSLLMAAKKEGYKEELLLDAGLIHINEEKGNTHDFFHDRIVFPISDRRGIAGFTCRYLPWNKTGPKYLNTKSTPVYQKSELPYNFYQAIRFIKENQNAYLVEGNADVIGLHQIGIYNSFAISGTSLTPGYIEQLKKITTCITLIGDTDNAGQNSVIKSAELILKSGMYCKIITLPHGAEKQDADSFFKDKATFDEYDDAPHKKDYILYLAEKEMNEDMQPDQKASIRKKLSALVRNLPGESHTDYYDQLGALIPPKSAWKRKELRIDDNDKKSHKEEAKQLLDESKNKKIEKYLTEKYEFRYNVIKCKPEYSSRNTMNWEPLDKVKLNSLKRELDAFGITSTTDNIKSILESDFSAKVDPIKEYFRSLPSWDNGDYIRELCNTIKTTRDDLFYSYFKKWIIGAVANAMEDDTCKNHLCLVLTGDQGKFKTSWLELLCPVTLREHYLFTGKIDPNNKDSQTLIAECFLINIDDQLRQLNKKDENELKNLITVNHIKYRRPYDVYVTDYPHLASFCASVNGRDFLTDTTGSRRFLPFEVISLDFQMALKINMDLVYSQAYYLYTQGERYWFNADEVSELHQYNENFMIVSNEEEMVLNYFDIPKSRNEATHFLSNTMIMKRLQELTGFKNISSKRLGEALKKLGFDHFQKRDGKTSPWVYALIEKTGEALTGENKDKGPNEHDDDFPF